MQLGRCVDTALKPSWTVAEDRGRGWPGERGRQPPSTACPQVLCLPSLPLCPTASASFVLFLLNSTLASYPASSLSPVPPPSPRGRSVPTADLRTALLGLPQRPWDLSAWCQGPESATPSPSLQPQVPLPGSPRFPATPNMGVGQTSCAVSCPWDFAHAIASPTSGFHPTDIPLSRLDGEAAYQVPQRWPTFTWASRVPPRP